MGFMAGFGKAFSNSFENAAARRATQERDAFAVAYEEYARRRTEYETDQKGWNNALSKAETMAARYGVPKEAVPRIAEMFRAGYSDEKVDDIVANTKFAVTPGVDQASDANNIAPVDAQMQQSGMAPIMDNAPTSLANPTPIQDPAQQEQPTNVQTQVAPEEAPVQQDTGILGNILGPDGIFKNAGESDIDQANRKVREAAGVDQTTFDQTMGGFKPPAMPENVIMEPKLANGQLGKIQELLGQLNLLEAPTKAKFAVAESTMNRLKQSDNPDDKAKVALWESMKPDMEARLIADAATDPEVRAETLRLINGTASPRQKLSDINTNSIAVVQTAKDLAEMAEKNSDVLTSVAGGVSVFEQFKREADAVFNLVGQMGNAGKSAEEVEASAMALVNEQISGGKITAEMAQAYSEFHSKTIRYIFAVGRALGSEGNGFSNNDYNNIKTSVISSTDVNAFVNNLKELSKEQFQRADATAQQTARMGEMLVLANVDPELYEVFAPSLTPLSQQDYAKDLFTWTNSARAGIDPNAGKKPVTQSDSSGQYVPGQTYNVEGYGLMVFKGGDYMDVKNWAKANQTGK